MAAAVEISHTPRTDAQIARRIRFVTATSLFDGHDASINVVRRLLQASGAEVVHLGHNRSVQEIVAAAVQEDADGIAVSSYQGGHMEYFKYIIDMLREVDRSEIRVFGGGGGVIVSEEIQELEQYGVAKIYAPADGQSIGLQGMIDDMLEKCASTEKPEYRQDGSVAHDFGTLARLISAIEDRVSTVQQLVNHSKITNNTIPVLGITGTGGSGKSSLTDELIQRFRLYAKDMQIAVIAIDPTRKKTGGALLGDRIRMNSNDTDKVFMRSLATREAGSIPEYLTEVLNACKGWNFDLVIVETPGMGQGDSAVVPFVDYSLYVMTPEFGAATQLEKIDMLDYADFVVVNKFDSKGAEDAYRFVCKQVQRNREAFDQVPSEMPVFGTVSSRFNDDGVTSLFHAIVNRIGGFELNERSVTKVASKTSTNLAGAIPASRTAYMAEIASTARKYRVFVEEQAKLVREVQHVESTMAMLGVSDPDSISNLQKLIQTKGVHLDPESKILLDDWRATKQQYRDHSNSDEMSACNGNHLYELTLSGTRIPRIGLPHYSDHGDLLQWLMLENLPGYFPYTAGVFPFKRSDEDPTRMFAGEGGPKRTNKRFKMLSKHSEAKRLSTAFDSVSLYGFDPGERPDIYGKIGNSGVSIATLDDMKDLYSGFDLCSSRTSVSMTINGPAPTYLALLLNVAIDQQTEKFKKKFGREPDESEQIDIQSYALRKVRGTVQADILKEDQGQNTCIFSTEFSLKVMGDIQEYFTANNIKKFYSVSISGYHIAEAGANPISQLAFTLANAFTYIELYLARGMKINDFAPNLSFFFSNGLDAEYTVMGRVARRIWAVALKHRYGANANSQRLKYHIQTSGRSLHAQEIDFNDIRTTLQALIAIYDNCNSLHTNAFDEAITTPTDESVRRALAIQLIINKEWGLAKNENPNQGSFILEELTDLVEEAVLSEFESISTRGGVLGAMETGYQRGQIQDQSLYYERKKHDGSLPIVGVNTFLNPATQEQPTIDLARSTDEEKRNQLKRLNRFHHRNEKESGIALKNLQHAVLNNQNIFEELMSTVRYCSVGQITSALFEVGGKYRRNM